MLEKQDPTNTLLFVYGTLMSHADNEIADTLSKHASKVSDGTFRGKMFRVSRPDGSLVYPAVVPSDDESDVVHGEIYRLSSPSLYDLLDEYEACGPNSPEPHEYERRTVDISIEHGKSIRAQIYLYAFPTKDLCPIESGSFREDIRIGLSKK